MFFVDIECTGLLPDLKSAEDLHILCRVER
jgi:hypothetical protein